MLPGASHQLWVVSHSSHQWRKLQGGLCLAWMAFCDPGWEPGLLQPLQWLCSSPASLQHHAHCGGGDVPGHHKKTRSQSRVPAAFKQHPGSPHRGIQGGLAVVSELLEAQPAASAPSSFLLPRRTAMLGQEVLWGVVTDDARRP